MSSILLLYTLTIYWEIFCLLFCCLLIFFKIIFLGENSFRNIYSIRVSNSLDPDQARHFVGPNLGPNCLQKLSADDMVKVISTYLLNIEEDKTHHRADCWKHGAKENTKPAK